MSFKTNLSLKEIVAFYRRAFSEQGLTENKLYAVIYKDGISLVFEGLTNGKRIVLQAVNAGLVS